ncbi:CCHC-type domain-containing protein [Trichonephila clavipes]|nr:CCHC-type domain-containing protein [Trichonephila clavipes]
MEEPIDLPRSAWEDPLKWLKEYDRVANFNKWDDMMCLANVYFFLDGTARQWYVNNEDALDSWEAFKNGLSGLFGDRQKIYQKGRRTTKMPSPAFRREYTVLHTKCIRTLPRRVGRPRFERLPNVVPVASLTDETDLVSLIRTIVREEVHRLVNQTQESLDSDPQSLEEIVQDEVERVLAPVSTKPTETRPRPTYAAVTRKYRAPVQKFPPEPRKTDVWRTADNRPVCFHCGRPGHIPVAISPDPVSRQAVGARKTKESDLPRGEAACTGNPPSTAKMTGNQLDDGTFLEASQAVIDCGQNELVLEDICRDSTAPDAWNLYATRDYTLKPHSLTRITVSGYQTRRHKCSSRRQQTFALREKYCYTVPTYRNGKSDVWVTNLQFRNQIIPRGMCIGQAEPLNEGHLCVISDTSGCLDDQQETSESQMNCSLMMSPELSDEQRNKLSNYSEIFWAFHEDRQVDSREDECETQDFYW